MESRELVAASTADCVACSITYKVIIPFRLYLNRIEKFSLRDSDKNMFLQRDKDSSRHKSMIDAVQALNAEIRQQRASKINESKAEGSEGNKEGDAFWEIMDLAEINSDSLSQITSDTEDCFLSSSLQKNKARVLTASVQAPSEGVNDSLPYHLDKIFCAFSGQFPQELGKAGIRLASIQVWFYDWNVGGIDFNVDMGLVEDHATYEAFNELKMMVLNLLVGYCKSPSVEVSYEEAKKKLAEPNMEYFSRSKEDVSLDLVIFDMLNAVGKAILEKCELKPSKRNQTDPISYIKIFLGRQTGLIFRLQNGEKHAEAAEAIGALVTPPNKKDKPKLVHDGLGRLFYLGSGADPAIVLYPGSDNRSNVLKSKVTWLWRIVGVYWSALEWLNVLFSKELDEVGVMYLERSKLNSFAAWRVEFVNLFKRRNEKKHLKRLLLNSHHSRNRLMGIMREFSVINLCDSDMECEILENMREGLYLAQLEKSVLDATDSLIGEQRKFLDDQRNLRIQVIQYLIIVNTAIGILGFTFDQFSIHLENCWLDDDKQPGASDSLKVDPVIRDSVGIPPSRGGKKGVH